MPTVDSMTGFIFLSSASKNIESGNSSSITRSVYPFGGPASTSRGRPAAHVEAGFGASTPRWTDTSLAFDWDGVPAAVVALGDAIDLLYWRSIDRPKVAHWLAAYELVRGTLTPNPASQWARGLPDDVLAGLPKGYTDAVLDDEFPLSMFFEALDKKMKPVIASTAGISGRDS